MPSVKFLFSEEDLEMKNEIEESFGKDIPYTVEHDFIGQAIAIYVIPTATLAVEILNFVFTVIQNNAKENEEKDIKQKRAIEVDDQRISLNDYTKDELIEILSSLGVSIQ